LTCTVSLLIFTLVFLAGIPQFGVPARMRQAHPPTGHLANRGLISAWIRLNPVQAGVRLSSGNVARVNWPPGKPIGSATIGYTNPTNQLDNVQQRERDMIVLGIILIVVGYLVPLPILITIGGILVVVGIILFILGAVGRPVGGRKVWF